MLKLGCWQEFISVRNGSASGRPEWPIPPLELRRIVGPTDPAEFDNPDGGPVFRDIDAPIPLERLYSSVFDFGCGCGRQARQLLQMQQPPSEYVGVDISQGLIRWCKKNLSHPDFRFHHHNVYDSVYAPRNSRARTRPLPFPRNHFTIINAHSVFTHLLIDQAEFYLKELCSLLADDGVISTTWFFFNRTMIPVLAEHQHCLFLNEVHPTQAVYYDWGWLQNLCGQLGLRIAQVDWPKIKGHQNLVVLTKNPSLGLPADRFTPDTNVLGF